MLHDRNISSPNLRGKGVEKGSEEEGKGRECQRGEYGDDFADRKENQSLKCSESSRGVQVGPTRKS